MSWKHFLGASSDRPLKAHYLITSFLAEALGLVERETGHQFSSEDMLAAQLIYNTGHIKERMVLQQLPVPEKEIQIRFTRLKPDQKKS